jgi:hypothetical protein
MIADDMIHGSFTLRRPRRMDHETPIVPRAIAEGVCEEASVWLKHPLPVRWVRELATRANAIYTHNARFRRKVKGGGNAGRDYLWMFMRHWLSALIQQHDAHLFARLPGSYCTGTALPRL